MKKKIWQAMASGAVAVLVLLFAVACGECRHESFTTFSSEKNPTCTEAGWHREEYICDECHTLLDVQQTQIPPTGHRLEGGAICLDCGFAAGSSGLVYEASTVQHGYVCVGVGTCTDEVIYIAEQINGLPVVQIDVRAFEGNQAITRVVMPSTVKSVGPEAFKDCINLKTVSIPDSVWYVASNAFDGCTSLKYTEKGGAFYLGNDKNPCAFLSHLLDKSIAECDIASSTVCISQSAFFGCGNIKKLVIPSGVLNISGSSFEGCSSLEELSLPDNLLSLGMSAISHCNNLKYYEYDGCRYLGNEKNPAIVLVEAVDKEKATYDIPETVRCIYPRAFQGCKLTSIVIPDRVTDIGKEAFDSCTELKSLKIGKSVICIQICAFYRCSSLEKVVLPPTELNVQAGAFAECTSLKEITIYSSTYNIGRLLLDGCTSIETVKFVGSEEEFNYIIIEEENEVLLNTKREYVSEILGNT